MQLSTLLDLRELLGQRLRYFVGPIRTHNETTSLEIKILRRFELRLAVALVSFWAKLTVALRTNASRVSGGLK